MEMATTQTAKTKTKPTTTTRTTLTTTTTTAAAAKVKVKTATGNGNPYTQNISTVKERKLQTTTVTYFKESSTRARAKATANWKKIQNNKTEIKISLYKQRNYLKFLIKNLYLKLKLILCISQINKSILNLHKTKTNTNNNNYNKKTTTTSDNCIINLRQQQEQEQQQLLITSFKTFTFKFNNILLKFLIKFNYYCRRPQPTKLEKYVKILIKIILHYNNKLLKHFVGICPKRLISLKRLKQIPENHAKNKIEHEQTLTYSTNYGKSKENLRKLQQTLRKVIKLPKINRKYCLKGRTSSHFTKSIRSNCLLRLCKETHMSSVLSQTKAPQNPYDKERPISKNQTLVKAVKLKQKFNTLSSQKEDYEQQINKKLSFSNPQKVSQTHQTIENESALPQQLKSALSSTKAQKVPQTFQWKEYEVGLVPQFKTILSSTKALKVSQALQTENLVLQFRPIEQFQKKSEILITASHLPKVSENSPKHHEVPKKPQNLPQTFQSNEYEIGLVPEMWNIAPINKQTELFSRNLKSSKVSENYPTHQEELTTSQRLPQTFHSNEYKMELVPMIKNIEEINKLKGVVNSPTVSENSPKHHEELSEFLPEAQNKQLRKRRVPIEEQNQCKLHEDLKQHEELSELLPEAQTIDDSLENIGNSKKLCYQTIPQYSLQTSKQLRKRRVSIEEQPSKNDVNQTSLKLYWPNNIIQPKLQECFDPSKENRPKTNLTDLVNPDSLENIKNCKEICYQAIPQYSLQKSKQLCKFRVPFKEQPSINDANQSRSKLYWQNNTIQSKLQECFDPSEENRPKPNLTDLVNPEREKPLINYDPIHTVLKLSAHNYTFQPKLQEILENLQESMENSKDTRNQPVSQYSHQTSKHFRKHRVAIEEPTRKYYVNGSSSKLSWPNNNFASKLQGIFQLKGNRVPIEDQPSKNYTKQSSSKLYWQNNNSQSKLQRILEQAEESRPKSDLKDFELWEIQGQPSKKDANQTDLKLYSGNNSSQSKLQCSLEHPQQNRPKSDLEDLKFPQGEQQLSKCDPKQTDLKLYSQYNSSLSKLQEIYELFPESTSKTNPTDLVYTDKLQNFSDILQIQPVYSYDLLKSTSLKVYKQNLADNSTEIPLNNNNSYKNSTTNSRHKESKQQKFLKKCQHFLSTILLYYCWSCCSCCWCIWHIYGYPLVLQKMFKYLKDSTVHVLTQRLKIAITTIAAAVAAVATSILYNYSSIKAACVGNLKKPTKMVDYKANNQQNGWKRQTATITTLRRTRTFGSCAYTSSSCSTTSLTGSSAYSSSLETVILQQPQKTWKPYCHYQQQHHHHHQQQPHHHRQNRQQQLLLHCYQSQPAAVTSSPSLPLPPQHPQPQPYSNSSTSFLHLPQPPSLLIFSRTLIILILLSSLWHTSEGFHGSGVKLSTNTVKTKYGLVRGIVVRSSPSLVEAYLGIPYASPPVGSLRFMPPITPSTWKNVRNADRFSPVCPQNVPIPPNGPEALLEVPRARLAQLRRLLPLLSNQSEDCLYLNIYVPYEHRRHRRFTTNSGESNDTPKLPIILFIHGESYEWNSGNPYDGSELAAHGNVIVVTINFRLGIFGFLKTGGKESSQGNFGLMDLVAGLHWLRENLPAFGGDPQAITLLGHGTGAALANILVVSPVSSDLIQHTVMVSGSALSPWAIQKNPLFVKRRVAEQTGCHGDMLYYDLAPCLRTKTVAELLAVKIDHPRFLVGFAPFIDGTVISPNTDAIGKLSLPLGSAIVSTSGIEYANFPKRNLIFCLTSVESHLDLSAQDLEFGFNETRRDRILRTYVRNNFHYHLNEIFAVLKNEYTDWDKAIRSPLSSRDATLQFLSDGHTASSLIKLGYMHSLRGGRGYFLHFKHRTVEEEYPQRTGSVRGEDVPFWLGLPISPLFPHNYTTQEKQISRLMLRYLANFAKTGNPNQSSLSSGQPSSSSLIGSPPSGSSSSSSASSSSASSSSQSQTADDSHEKVKRSSFNIVNATSSSSSSSSAASPSSGPIKSNAIVVDVETAAAREALNLAVLYNQRRTKRTYYKRHSRSNDDHSGSASSEVNYFLSLNNNNNNNKLDGDELPFWDAYDVVNQLYMELGNKAEIQSHYRGHKLSMWLNLIPQLHRHANMNDQSMRHHQFQDDLNNLNLYEGIVRAQMQTKPDDDDETILLPRARPTPPPVLQETNTTQKPIGGTTECGVDGAMFVAEMTTVPPSDNRSLVLDSREKEMATASTGLIGNLEVLRRLSGKQFQSYTTALVATVAVGCFLLILNILIFAGIYHQREKRARDAKTKEELQDNDTSKNSSMLKLNALGSETGSFNGSGAGVSGKTTVVFGEYSCYDEKSLQTKDEKLIVELPPPQMVDPNWAACSTSTLDLLKTKHHTPLDTTYTLSNVMPINTESQTDHLMAVNAMEMSTYNPLPMTSGLIIDPSLAATATTSSGLLSKRGSFVGSAGQLNQYDFASVQSSDQMSFKDIENAVKASATMDDDITHDDDIPEPPPPPRSFHNMQQQQQQQQQQGGGNVLAAASGSGGGILRQAGTTSATQTGGGKKRVHIQEISV